MCCQLATASVRLLRGLDLGLDLGLDVEAFSCFNLPLPTPRDVNSITRHPPPPDCADRIHVLLTMPMISITLRPTARIPE